ncbi:MAG: hypothetical protein JW923_09230 [Spirochaetales bacterium]|nr:hypothetical protein [Spirochaetales bacterium]
MKKPSYLTVAVLAVAVLAACSNPTIQPSSDNDILTMVGRVSGVPYSGTITGTDIEITFPSTWGASDVASVTMEFTLSAQATLWDGTTQLQNGISTVDLGSPVTLTVKAEDGSTKTYTVSAAFATILELQRLDIEDNSSPYAVIPTTPTFDADTTSYTASSTVDEIKIYFTAVDTSADVYTNFNSGGWVLASMPSRVVTLISGSNTFLVRVTTDNSKIYTITISR